MFLAAHRITKSYGPTRALEKVSLELQQGEVHALLGMNGAGKSTLVNILCGAEEADDGDLRIDAEMVRFGSRQEALGAGVALVPQHLTVYPDLDLTANLFIGVELVRSGLISRRRERLAAREVLRRVGIAHDPNTLAAVLTTGECQLLEVARSLLSKPRVLLLDEPTAALPTAERDRLFEIIRTLAAEGVAIALITHFIGEAVGIADRVTVLRDHRVVIAGEQCQKLSVPRVVSAMTGPERVQVERPVPRDHLQVPRGMPTRALDVLDLAGEGLTGVSFSVKSGEIVGLAGLMGSGIEEMFKAVTAQKRRSTGHVVYPDRRRPKSMAAAVRSGLAYVPPDRTATGIMAEKSILENVELVSFGRTDRATLSVLPFRTSLHQAQAILQRLSVRFTDVHEPVRNLSGGNQQKILLSKWMHADASVYVLDDPTRAVDIHAKREIHRILKGLRETGAHILIASTDPEELIDLCDRVLIVSRGRIMREIDQATGLSIDAMLTAMSPLPLTEHRISN